jgi:hypothetical protein
VPTAKFLEFLQAKVSTTRTAFLEAKLRLEEYEREWGSLVYIEAWQREDGVLSQAAAHAYTEYRKAWTEWYAAIHGYSLQNRNTQKDTPGFASPIAIRQQSEFLVIVKGGIAK